MFFQLKETKTKRSRRAVFRPGLFLLSVVFTALSCTPATGILYIIENETAVFNEDHGLPKASLISGIVSDGTSYFAKGSLIYVADVPTGQFTHYGQTSDDSLNRTPITNWAKLNNPNSDVSLVSAVVSGTTIYAIFVANASSGTGGFFSVSDVTNGNAGGKSWNALATTGLPDGARLESLFSLNGNVVMQVSNAAASGTSGRVYSLYVYNGTSFSAWTAQVGVDVQTFLPFIDAKWTGTEALLLKRNALYTSTNFTTFTDEDLGSYPSGLSQNTPDPAFSCLAVDGSSNWYIGSQKGFVMAKIGAAAWTHSASLASNSAGKPYAITSMAFVHMTDVGRQSQTFDRLIVGTQSNGLLYVNDDYSLTTWQTMDGYSGSYIGTSLYKGGINDILVSDNSYQIFISTASHGVYSAVFDGTETTTANPTTPGLQWSSE